MRCCVAPTFFHQNGHFLLQYLNLSLHILAHLEQFVSSSPCRSLRCNVDLGATEMHDTKDPNSLSGDWIAAVVTIAGAAEWSVTKPNP